MKDYKKEVFVGVDVGKPGGDMTAYAQYWLRHDGVLMCMDIDVFEGGVDQKPRPIEQSVVTGVIRDVMARMSNKIEGYIIDDPYRDEHTINTHLVPGSNPPRYEPL